MPRGEPASALIGLRLESIHAFLSAVYVKWGIVSEISLLQRLGELLAPHVFLISRDFRASNETRSSVHVVTYLLPFRPIYFSSYFDLFSDYY